MTDREPAATVYFDGACPLCRMEIGHYKSQPGAACIAFVDASQSGAELGSGLDRDTALARFHVRDRNGALVSGAAAFAVIWDLLPRWRWAARLARLPGMPALLEAAYRVFLLIRRAISRMAGRLQRQCSASDVWSPRAESTETKRQMQKLH